MSSPNVLPNVIPNVSLSIPSEPIRNTLGVVFDVGDDLLPEGQSPLHLPQDRAFGSHRELGHVSPQDHAYQHWLPKAACARY